MDVYYLISPSGKGYVGQAQGGADNRWKSHISMANGNRSFAITNALRKYGPENFARIVLVTVDTLDELNFWEEFFIRILDTKSPNGYNLTSGGDGVRNPSPETRKRMSETRKFSHNKPDVKKLLSEGTRRAQSRPGARERMSKIQKAVMARPGQREKTSAAVKRAMENPEVRERFLIANRAAAKQPGRQERNSAAGKARMARPGEREKTSAATKLGMARPDVIEKMRNRILPPWTEERLKKHIACRPRGSKHHGTGLTEDDVRLIRWARKDAGYTSKKLAEIFDLSGKDSVNIIVRGRTWSHVI